MLTYLHGDHLGSASLATDASGAKITDSDTRYSPYGVTRPGLAGTGLPTDRRFTGQREEVSLGLYDYGARPYAPALGRFLQADTLVPNPANPQSLNRYAYTLNNPLRYTDPSGHREIRYGEGEIIDESTINSNVYVEWNPLNKQERAEVLLDAIGILGVPVVAIAAPAYAGRGALSAVGYVGGTWATSGEIAPTELLLAFYIGGIDINTLLGRLAFLSGGVSNDLQYFAACGIRGETPTVADMSWNMAAGVVATGLQGSADNVMNKLAVGISKGATPFVADTTAQWLTTNMRDTFPQLAIVPLPGYAPGNSPGQMGPYSVLKYPAFGDPAQHEHYFR